MAISNGDTVTWFAPFLAEGFILPVPGYATVIDADPNATMVSVQVEDEPFFRRIPAWMLQVIQ